MVYPGGTTRALYHLLLVYYPGPVPPAEVTKWSFLPSRGGDKVVIPAVPRVYPGWDSDSRGGASRTAWSCGWCIKDSLVPRVVQNWDSDSRGLTRNDQEPTLFRPNSSRNDQESPESSLLRKTAESSESSLLRKTAELSPFVTFRTWDAQVLDSPKSGPKSDKVTKCRNHQNRHFC